jgi:hypothetical protein
MPISRFGTLEAFPDPHSSQALTGGSGDQGAAVPSGLDSTPVRAGLAGVASGHD